MKMYSNKKNFCGGNFQDWLEVNLTDKCNGKCSWCIERSGFHPEKHVTWKNLVDAIRLSRSRHIILLGGEPTLYPHIKEILTALADQHYIYITTNGSKITEKYVRNNLLYLHGLNISIHHFDLNRNTKITGISLNEKILRNAIKALHKQGTEVRFNCNLISGEIDTEKKMREYIALCKRMGANSVRFAELKGSEGSFVDLAKICNYKYGLNDNPFVCGCNQKVKINNFPVSLRQMCGLNTSTRKKPNNPQSLYKKRVLYYDGKIYDGWQTGGTNMEEKKAKILSELMDGIDEDTDVSTLKETCERVMSGDWSMKYAKEFLGGKQKEKIKTKPKKSESEQTTSSFCNY
jgi:organic radical activating enzyme